MTKRFFGLFALAVLVVSVAAPLSAQSVRLTAKVPFEFTVGNQTLPAGEYALQTPSSSYLVQIRNMSTHAGVIAMTGSANSGIANLAGSPRLVFNKYGDRYVLHQIWDGASHLGHELPVTRAERELTKTASVDKIEIVAMLTNR